MTALAASTQQASAQTGQTGTSVGPPGVAPEGNAVGAGAQLPQPEPVQSERSPAHYPWAVLIAPIYEAFSLVCPLCGGPMRLAFMTQGHRSAARGPPLWDNCDAQVGDGVQIERAWHLAAQPAPDYEVDQRVNW